MRLVENKQSGARRPSYHEHRAQRCRGIKTLIRKEVMRVMRIWVQTIVPPAITMTLYFIIFGNLIGRRIGQMDGFDYMQYIAPGLIMMSVITNSYGNVVSSFFGAKFGQTPRRDAGRRRCRIRRSSSATSRVA